MSSEPERVGDRDRLLAVGGLEPPCTVRDVVEVEAGLALTEVEGRRDRTLAQREDPSRPTADLLLIGASWAKAWFGRRWTKEPEPCRETTTPSACSRDSASRTTGRDTPNSVQSWLSEGSFSPSGSAPVTILERICS